MLFFMISNSDPKMTAELSSISPNFSCIAVPSVQSSAGAKTGGVNVNLTYAGGKGAVTLERVIDHYIPENPDRMPTSAKYPPLKSIIMSVSTKDGKASFHWVTMPAADFFKYANHKEKKQFTQFSGWMNETIVFKDQENNRAFCNFVIKMYW